jgi:hypothetical protein
MMSTTSLPDTVDSVRASECDHIHSTLEAAPQCLLPPRVGWLRVFEHSVFWFLPPAFSRFLVTIAVAGTHLVYVCVSQMMGMLGMLGGGTAGRDNVCIVGSFFWRVAVNLVGEYFVVLCCV